MDRGKRICRTLKELRKRIADANGIPYEIEECPYDGPCRGTCPKCEDELKYLHDALEDRQREGLTVTLEGLMSEEDLRLALTKELEQTSTRNSKRMYRMGEVHEDLRLEDEPEEQEPFELAGIPAPPEEEMMVLQGDICEVEEEDEENEDDGKYFRIGEIEPRY